VVAPEQTLEVLVRDELRGPVVELVRRLVPELAQMQRNGHEPKGSQRLELLARPRTGRA
jgi:hypothetical protein